MTIPERNHVPVAFAEDANGTPVRAGDLANLAVRVTQVAGVAGGYTAVDDQRLVVPVAGTRVQFPNVVTKVIAMTAETDNTGEVVVGGSGVIAALATRRGIPMAAGDSVILAVTNLNLLWLDATVNGDGVTYVTLS